MIGFCICDNLGSILGLRTTELMITRALGGGLGPVFEILIGRVYLEVGILDNLNQVLDHILSPFQVNR